MSVHPWKVVEDVLDRERMRLRESLTSTGNGYMGMRGNFEEDYSGDTHLGTYIGGVWFPDKTRVGWWKNGYPQYFGKVINAVRLNGIHVEVDGEPLDLAKVDAEAYYRELDMQTGVILRTFTARMRAGRVRVRAERFVSLAQKELLAIRYELTAENGARVVLKPYLDGDVRNLDSNYDERFWDLLAQEEGEDGLALLTKTKENPFGTPRFAVGAAMSCWADGLEMESRSTREGYVEMVYAADVPAGETVSLEKYALCFTSRDWDEKTLTQLALKAASRAREVGYDALREAHVAAWAERWAGCDVTIEGDDAAQQGVRFNLFQLLSTYSGDDARLNIGPKGFTGEKYGGATYWDTEAYCLPLYMAIAGQDVARQLLRYRYLQLSGARHNARMQGLPGALYPMVTFTGVECHNEWEITFEEIHRNAAIAYAIFNYVAYTGDEAYIDECGIDVANYNSPGQIVISGEKSKLAAAVDELKARGMRKVIVLNVAGAFHSRLMAAAGEALKPVLEATPMRMPSVAVFHNFTAAPATDLATLRANLAAQVAGSVRWEECVRGLVAAGGDTMIEFGPGNVLTGLLRRTLPEVPAFNINSAEALEKFAI